MLDIMVYPVTCNLTLHKDVFDFTSLVQCTFPKVFKNEMGDAVKMCDIRAVTFKKDSPNEFF